VAFGRARSRAGSLDRKTDNFLRTSCFRVESERDAQIGRLCSAPAADGKRHAPGRIAIEPERATVEGDFLSILALIAITINGLPPPSWPALCRPSTPSGSAIDSAVLIALYFQPLRAGYNGVIVDGRVKPGHDDLSRPRTTKQHLSLQEARSFCRFFLTKSEICPMCSYWRNLFPLGACRGRARRSRRCLKTCLATTLARAEGRRRFPYFYRPQPLEKSRF
jgi:hypothetical protein